MFSQEWLLIITISVIEYSIIEKYARPNSKFNLKCLIFLQLFIFDLIKQLFKATALLNTVMSMIKEYEKTCPVDDFQFQLGIA